MTTDEKIAFLRQFVNMGHTPGNGESTENTSFSMNLPDFMEHLSYDDVVTMMNELATLAVCNVHFDSSQRLAYWFLQSNGIIAAFQQLDHYLEHEHEQKH